jgi:hypothetical protein
MSKFKYGVKDYATGNNVIWELFRTVYQMTQRPYVIGALALASGYVWSLMRRPARPITPEMVAFIRREQMRRLKALLSGFRPKASLKIQACK